MAAEVKAWYQTSQSCYASLPVLTLIGSPRARKMDGVLPPDKDRFIIELEFVQSLANPEYLHCTLGGPFHDHRS